MIDVYKMIWDSRDFIIGAAVGGKRTVDLWTYACVIFL